MQDLWRLSATEMLAALDDGSTTSVDLVEALHARADVVEPMVRGFTEQYRQAALDRAASADQARCDGVSWGPLHGLPVSIKENFALVGTPATLGIQHRLHDLADTDAVVVRNLLDAGAIVLGKTNVPQLLLAIETDNDIWGPTHNPWKLGRVTGGSSGGEAAVIATGASPLGVGTDIGGSIRNPAAYCGICGLKPTWQRWSTQGQGGGQPGQEAIHAQGGPMARTVADLILLMNALSPAAQHALDPNVPPVPFLDPASVKLEGMRVGIYEDDGVFEPSASVRRAVRDAGLALSSLGVEVVPFAPTAAWEMFDVYFSLLSADGFETAFRVLQGEPLTQPLSTVGRMAKLPSAIRLSIARGLALVGDKRIARMLRQLGAKAVAKSWQLQAARDALKRAELEAWRDAGIDVLIGPPVVTPAPVPGGTHDWAPGNWQCMRYNLLDLPAGVVPVSRVQPDEQVRTTLNDRLDRRAATFEADSAGLPLGVQVIGKPWEEHKVLAIMAAIERVRKSHATYPSTPVDPKPPYGVYRGERA